MLTHSWRKKYIITSINAEALDKIEQEIVQQAVLEDRVSPGARKGKFIVLYKDCFNPEHRVSMLNAH